MLNTVCEHTPLLAKDFLVNCRQNVANKLFITCYFNPVHPCTWNKL